MSTPLNIAVIGVRGFGSSYFETIAKIAGARVVAVCDLDQAAASQAARDHAIPQVFSDYKECIARAGAEAIFVATPHFLHFPMVRDALQAGKHVFCEKPLALDGKEAGALARLSRQVNRVLSCHYNQRLHPRGQFLRHWTSQNALGPIYHAEARWMARWTEFMVDPVTSWRTDPAKAGGGILIGRGSHLLDLLLYVLDWPKIETIAAQANSQLSRPGIDDFASIRLQLQGGATLTVTCSYLAHRPGPDELLVDLYGVKGGASAVTRGESEERIAGSCDLASGKWMDWPEPVLETNASQSVIEDFVLAVQTGREPLVTAEQAALVAQVVDTAYVAAKENSVISFPRADDILNRF